MAWARSVYNTFFRSNSIMITTVFATAFGMQIGLDITADKWWDSTNRGRQWKDIKHKYVEKADE